MNLFTKITVNQSKIRDKMLDINFIIVRFEWYIVHKHLMIIKPRFSRVRSRLKYYIFCEIDALQLNKSCKKNNNNQVTY